MDLSIKLLILLPLVMSAMAAPTAGPQEDILQTLINPPLNTDASTSAVTTTTNNNNINNIKDNMVGDLTLGEGGQQIKSVKELRDVLTASVKSQVITSFANMSPEQVSTITGAANADQMSQLNLMGGINKLVGLIVQKILESLLPRIFGQNTGPSPVPVPVTPNVGTGLGGVITGGLNPQPTGGMFGGMNPMSMMIPGMIFNMMENFL